MAVTLTGPAAARLYDDHVDAVHALVTRRVGPTLGSSITAEVFEQAARSWDRFDPDSGTERLFLFGIATVVLRGHLDAERRHLISLRPPERTGGAVRDPLVAPTTTDGGSGAAPDRDTSGRSRGQDHPDDEIGRTMVAVADLDPDDRDILLLSLWEGCQHSAIAEALDLAVGTVRSSTARIRRELKQAVAAATTDAVVNTGDTGERGDDVVDSTSGRTTS